MPPLNWQAVVDTMPKVRKMVHLAGRRDMYDEAHLKTTLLREGRRAYNLELTSLAQRMGCPGRSGQLANGPFLTELDDIYAEHAKSIVNTFNYDLALQVEVTFGQNYRANRHTYAKEIRGWQKTRDQLRRPQMTMMTESVARSLAQQHFFQMNGSYEPLAVAVLLPGTAVCPVCQGWIDRGEIPVHEAENNPPPYHVNCPHKWSVRTKENLTKEDCALLWMGE